MAQFVAVLCRRTVGVFIKAPAKRSQIIKACLESDIRDREIPVCGEHVLGFLDAFVA